MIVISKLLRPGITDQYNEKRLLANWAGIEIKLPFQIPNQTVLKSDNIRGSLLYLGPLRRISTNEIYFQRKVENVKENIIILI